MQQVNKKILLSLLALTLLLSADTWDINDIKNNLKDIKIPNLPAFLCTHTPTVTPTLTPLIPTHTITCTKTPRVSPTVTPTFTVTPIQDAQSYYPVQKGYVWYYKGYKKNEPNKVYDVKAEIIDVRKIDDKDYCYYYAPQFNIRSFLRSDHDGVYMKVIRFPYPVLNFMSIDIYFYPEIKFVDFNKRPGETWVEKVKAQAQVLSMTITRDITAKFEFVGIEKVKVGDKEIPAFHIRNNIDQGDGIWHIEDNWYAKGIGYAGGENENQYAKLYKFEINKPDK